MLSPEERKKIFDKEALAEALRLTSVENVALILACYKELSAEDFIAVCREIVRRVYK